MSRRVPVPRLRLPVVLVHGLCGFLAPGVGVRQRFSYFPNLVDPWRRAGNRVFIPQLDPMGGVVQRAGELAAFLERVSPHEPVHLLAHSMGGLDGRHLIGPLGYAHRVASLTTLGTPHRGSSFMDWGFRHFAPWITRGCRVLRWSTDGMRSVTTTACAQLPAPPPSVRCFSVAGVACGVWLSAEWRFSHRIVANAEGPNDGLVALTSAHFGEVNRVWPAAHMDLVNWPNLRAVWSGAWRGRHREFAELLGQMALAEG
jgi:triacylglycerol lipase